tara:strand:+ start:370 stop:555 length:186 start_codon:yes stop_codon:yes gene_type:complete
MDNTLERVIMEDVIYMMERAKDKGEPLSEEDAFDLTIEQLEETLSYYTLKGCKEVVGNIDY